MKTANVVSGGPPGHPKEAFHRKKGTLYKHWNKALWMLYLMAYAYKVDDQEVTVANDSDLYNYCFIIIKNLLPLSTAPT